MRGLKNTDTPGLFKHESGNFWGRIAVGGSQKYKSFRTDNKVEAQSALARWRADLTHKRAAKGADNASTVGYWLDKLQKRYNLSSEIGDREKTYCKERIRGLELTWPEVFTVRVANITKAEIEAYKQRCLKEKSASTTRGNLLFLKLGLDEAVEANILTENPMTKGIRFQMPFLKRGGKVEKKHETTPEEFDRVIAHMQKQRGTSRRASELAELMAYSGCRVSEARAITWAWVDWEGKTMQAPNAKGRLAKEEHERTKTLPFFPRLEDLLTRLTARYGGDRTSRLVKVRECSITLSNACKALGVPRLTQHDLRHLFATWAIEYGATIPTVAGWLGHTDGGALLMARYNHLTKKHSHAQAAMMPKPAAHPPAKPTRVRKPKQTNANHPSQLLVPPP